MNRGVETMKEANSSNSVSAARSDSPDTSPVHSSSQEQDSPKGEHQSIEHISKESDRVDVEKSQSDDSNIVDWEPNDPKNPMNWSSTRKWSIISLVSLATFNVLVLDV